MLRRFAVGLPGLLLAGCASQPVGLTDLAPSMSAADPGLSTTGGGYKTIIGPYTPRSPASPSGWLGTGVEVAPLASPSSGAATGASAPEAE